VLGRRWEELYDEVKAFREACGDTHLKVILGTGELSSLRNVLLAALVAMMAGADFVKTSTGKESVNATLPVGLAMVRAIRVLMHRQSRSARRAGGISTARQSLTGWC
jgi:deoxyribose-phosphate aldolase